MYLFFFLFSLLLLIEKGWTSGEHELCGGSAVLCGVLSGLRLLGYLS